VRRDLAQDVPRLPGLRMRVDGQEIEEGGSEAVLFGMLRKTEAGNK
jgi:hypothetical protein